MRKKCNAIWIAAMLTAAVLTGFSGCTEGEIPSLSSSDTNHNCITGRIRRREQHRGNSRNFCRRNGSRNGNCGNHSGTGRNHRARSGNHFGGNDNSSRSRCRHLGICGCGKDTVRGVELHRPDRQRQPAER